MIIPKLPYVTTLLIHVNTYRFLVSQIVLLEHLWNLIAVLQFYVLLLILEMQWIDDNYHEDVK